MNAPRATDATPLSLLIGGTGMLRPVAHTLMERGHDVAVIARRPVRGAGRGARGGAG